MITIALIARIVVLYNKRKAAKLVPVRSTYNLQPNR